MVGEASLTFWHYNLVTRYFTLVSAQNRPTAGYSHKGHLSIRNIHNRSKIKSQYLPFFTSTETSRTYNKLQLESSTCPTHGYFCMSLYCISYIVYFIELINFFTYLKVGKSEVKSIEQQRNICTASVTFQLLVISFLLPTHHQ